MGVQLWGEIAAEVAALILPALTAFRLYGIAIDLVATVLLPLDLAAATPLYLCP